MLSTLNESLTVLASQARNSQSKSWNCNQDPSWHLPEGYQVKYSCLENEVLVDGIYLRLFLENPGFHIRNPQKFSESLLKRYIETSNDTATASTMLETLCTSVIILMSNYPQLSDYAVSVGYIPRLFSILDKYSTKLDGNPSTQDGESLDSLSARTSLRLIHALSCSSLAPEAMARCVPKALPILIRVLDFDHNMTITSLEIQKRIFTRDNSSRDLLIHSALELNLLQKLLSMLDWKTSSQDESEDQVAIIRVLCVDIVNAIASDNAYLEQVHQILGSSDVWSAYSGQRHDLFLPSGASQTTSLVGLLESSKPPKYLLTSTAKVGGNDQDEEEPIDAEAVSKIKQSDATKPDAEEPFRDDVGQNLNSENNISLDNNTQSSSDSIHDEKGSEIGNVEEKKILVRSEGPKELLQESDGEPVVSPHRSTPSDPVENNARENDLSNIDTTINSSDERESATIVENEGSYLSPTKVTHNDPLSMP